MGPNQLFSCGKPISVRDGFSFPRVWLLGWKKLSATTSTAENPFTPTISGGLTNLFLMCVPEKANMSSIFCAQNRGPLLEKKNIFHLNESIQYLHLGKFIISSHSSKYVSSIRKRERKSTWDFFRFFYCILQPRQYNRLFKWTNK